MDINTSVAKAFGATLVLTGLGGFVVAQDKAPTSDAPAYNVFHVASGAIAIAASRRNGTARAFNLGFGLIDLYQAAASRRGWFPKKWFRWKPADDVLHVVIGAALVAAALAQRRN